jgi:predicted amidohydrolase
LTGKTKIRVAAVQFGVVADVDANLQTCVRMIDRAAAECQPKVMVLPEFVNHIAWYENNEHAYRVAVSLDDEFMRAIGRKAAEHGCFIKINVTLKRENGKITGTNVLFGPGGQIIGLTDKQILMGNENNFLEKSTTIAPILETEIGPVGMYCCMDGVIPEVARALAVRRPQILLNSLNSFAHDEASLHIPVRAAENKVFVVAANKVGSLVPDAMRAAVAARLKIDPSFLEGAGESQIVAPDGRVLAIAPKKGEAVVFADIDPADADDKRRPDGTDILLARRPALYRPIGDAPTDAQPAPGAESVLGAVFQPRADGPAAIMEAAEALGDAIQRGAKLVVFPELFHIPGGRVENPADAAEQSTALTAALAQILSNAPEDVYAAFTVVEHVADGWQHSGLLLNCQGVALRQAQLHATGRHPWVSVLGQSLAMVETAWGRVALVLGGDSIYPETYRLAALQHVSVVATPAMILEPWESALGFPERAAENRMNLLVADRAESAIYAITEDFTLWTEWKNRPFDGNINVPVIARAQTGLTLAALHPAAAINRFVSHRTNVVDGRPWALAEPIIT